MTFGDKEAGILDDHDRAISKWADLLGGIMEDLARLEVSLVDMKLECLRLEADGMWPAVPSESWEGRNGGDPVYLRLVFPRRVAARGYVRRKVYIGADPARIATARRKARNRRKWEELQREIGQLEGLLNSAEMSLQRDASRLARCELPDLGTGAAARGRPGVPNLGALTDQVATDLEGFVESVEGEGAEGAE